MHSCLYLSRLGSRRLYSPAIFSQLSPRRSRFQVLENGRRFQGRNLAKSSYLESNRDQDSPRNQHSNLAGNHGVDEGNFTAATHKSYTLPIRSVALRLDDHSTDTTDVRDATIYTDPRQSWMRSTEVVRRDVPIFRQYRQIKDPSEREEWWSQARSLADWGRPSTILVHYMYMGFASDEVRKAEFSSNSQLLETLDSFGYTMDDVSKWAWIMSGDGPDEIANRFVSVQKQPPLFLLLEVLRPEFQHVRTLRTLLIYVWENIIEKPSSFAGPVEKNDEAVASLDSIDINRFGALITRLLYQTRRLWPSALVSVAQMVAPLVHSRTDFYEPDADMLQTKQHETICRLINDLICTMSLPSMIDPFQSTIYNWEAQKTMLRLSGQLGAPMVLTQSSYEAIVQVLAASKKTDTESMAASLRSRDWPPWRVHQDGIDAARSQEDDLSLVVAAIQKSRESGFRDSMFLQQMNIYGGQDLDGTPTIHTRKILRPRMLRSTFDEDMDPLHPNLWAARIEATRDVQEAWNIFMSHRDQGGVPNRAMYLQMFIKLEFEAARISRENDTETAPGDGKEVVIPKDDNFSEYYKQISKPPTKEQLYQKMLASGIRPWARCLDFLLRHAPDLATGLRYLNDSGMDGDIISYLKFGASSNVSPDVVKRMSVTTFANYLLLLCRFSPRVLRYLQPPADEQLEPESWKNKPFIWEDSKGRTWRVQHPGAKVKLLCSSPLQQAAFLLKTVQPLFRPAWYALFAGLARKGVILSRRIRDFHKNDAIAWQILTAALSEFNALGMELDPHGFLSICHGFEKYARTFQALGSEMASSESLEDELSRLPLFEASNIIRAEWVKLAESNDAVYTLPRLLHTVAGVFIHGYVRCMGAVQDYEEIMSTLKWMVKHQEELAKQDAQRANGPRMTRRALTSILYFLKDNSEYSAMAKELIEGVESWNGGPTEQDLAWYNRGDLYSGVMDKQARVLLDEYNQRTEGKAGPKKRWEDQEVHIKLGSKRQRRDAHERSEDN